MKTAHQFARELLAGPDIPIFHFDPSCAGYNPDDDTSISPPVAEVVNAEKDENGKPYPPFLTIVGNQHKEWELEEGT
jgi:hypothetical protein